MYKSIDDIRQEFLKFFQKKEHHIIPSSSLVPENDPTLLFTNSGMNQFKNIFLGFETPQFTRVVTVQYCMRAGGKHNDLDTVGYTERHLTLFEMLGNFSFGDYFKYDAIQFAWELLTSSNWFNLSKDKIWVTTHVQDYESYNIWKKDIGISSEHIVKIGNKHNNFYDSDNFWQMGNTGPCGPCSEIFYDRGSSFHGSPPGSITVTGERYIEIWNLVFVQFDRQINGNLKPLSMFSVDTGMGLERVTSILQNVPSNYLIDIFKKLIFSISQIIQVNTSISNRSLYVIADHIRACAFLIKDGVRPSNTGRGYVLRRIIRRAVCHGKKIGINNIFFYKLVAPLINNISCITDILCDYKDCIELILFNEEKLFANTLRRGLELLEMELKKLKNNNDILDGSVAFRLYTTYGFPFELTKEICHERNIQVDQLTFEKMILKEKKLTKQLNQFNTVINSIVPCSIDSIFVGYDYLSYQSVVLGLLHNNQQVNMLVKSNQKSIIILNITPFYGESGGQVGDTGYLKTEHAIFEVTDTKKYGKVIMHEGFVNTGIINLGDQIFSEVDQSRRKNICVNHSATHLLHAALLQILGKHITQQGSLVNDKYLRFDFSHHGSLTIDQINIVENMVNQQIWNNTSILADSMSIESAKKIGVIRLLCKQYDRVVRVLKIGDFSIELCGGTHVKYTGEIGFFSIIKETSIGSGIRRIEAVTKNSALSFLQNKRLLIQNIEQIMHSNDFTIVNKVYELKSCYNKLEKEVKYLKNKQEFQKYISLEQDICYIKSIPILLKQFKNVDVQLLLNLIKSLKLYCTPPGIVIFLNIKDNSMCHLMICVNKNFITLRSVDAVNLVHDFIHSFGGKGGGKSNFAQARINKALTESIVKTKIRILLESFV